MPDMPAPEPCPGNARNSRGDAAQNLHDLRDTKNLAMVAGERGPY